jgi:hypothetical protein
VKKNMRAKADKAVCVDYDTGEARKVSGASTVIRDAEKTLFFFRERWLIQNPEKESVISKEAPRRTR